MYDATRRGIFWKTRTPDPVIFDLQGEVLTIADPRKPAGTGSVTLAGFVGGGSSHMLDGVLDYSLLFVGSHACDEIMKNNGSNRSVQ